MQQAMLLESQAARTNGACNKKTAARHTMAAHFFLSRMCAFTMRSKALQNTLLGYAKRRVSKNNLSGRGPEPMWRNRASDDLFSPVEAFGKVRMRVTAG